MTALRSPLPPATSAPLGTYATLSRPMRRISKHSLVLLLLLVGCGKLKELPTEPGLGGGEPIDPTATLTRVQAEIFTPTCGALGCHDPLGRQENMILTAGNAYANTVGVTS